MEIFVKKDNGLKKLGEGKIYSKSQLRLTEILNGVDANLGTADGLQQAQASAKQIFNRNPNVTSASADAGKLDGQTDADGGEGVKLELPVNATGNQLATAQHMVKDQSADDTQITFTKPEVSSSSMNNTNGLGESRIIEMRKNSIPFTKSELSSFLNSL